MFNKLPHLTETDKEIIIDRTLDAFRTMIKQYTVFEIIDLVDKSEGDSLKLLQLIEDYCKEHGLAMYEQLQEKGKE